MSAAIGVNVGCQIVGDFVVENTLPGAAPPGAPPPARGEVVHPIIVAEHVESFRPQSGARDFKILLRDNRMVTVRGHALSYVANPSNPTDCGSYGVLARSDSGDALVALFRASEVTGIFSGEMQPMRESA